MHDIVIVGAGGFAREVFTWAQDSFGENGYRFKGYIDDDSQQTLLTNRGLNWLGSISKGPHQYRVQPTDRFLFAIGRIEVKARLIETLKEQAAIFLTMIHPTALVAESAEIGQGVVICPYALISDNAKISDFVLINFYASCAHDTSVGAYSVLSPYATLNGFAQIESETFLGTHATVTANRTVGYRSKVSANSVVMTDVPPKSIVYGVPGKYKTIFF